MLRTSHSQSGFSGARLLLGSLLCICGVLLAMFCFEKSKPVQPESGGRLRLARLNADPTGRHPKTTSANDAAVTSPNLSVVAPFSYFTPTFGHPVISGIGGNGFEQDIRLDPTNPNRIYTSAPASLSSDTSWIWHSRDGGKTFKWVTAGTPLEGKSVACAGGGDTELGVDSAGHLYFCDLTLANFSTARSDDFGNSFLCSNTGVPDTVVDRQWYAIDGDPTNGGTIYLANDDPGPGNQPCPAANELVMYRSPAAAAAGATAGIQFGPRNQITPPTSCDEGIMGNNEVSPVATTTGNGATLATPVKHIYVIHDDDALHQIRIGRCFPVAFGPPVPNVSDPSGLNCTDLLVKELGAGTALTGGSFATMAIDKAGNLYAVWEQAPRNSNARGSNNITGDTVLMYSYSTNEGNTWSAPVQINTSGSSVGTLHNNVFAWIVAGDDGRVDIVWYGTPGAPTYPSNGPDSCPASCFWSLWMVQSLNAHDATPTFTAPVQASEHFIHRGSIQTVMGGQTGDRTLGDFLQVRMGANGEAQISYADSNNINEATTPHAMYVRQNGGAGLLAASSPVNIPGLAPFNTVSDPTGDGKYEVSGTTSANMPQLDITNSSVSKVTTAPCSAAAPCYKIVMQLNNLSLSPTTAQDPDPDLVWLTQWHVPSTTDANGGKAFFVYGESTNGGALTCYSGETATTVVGGGVAMTYPGATTLPAANCQSTLGNNGKITIYVPLTNVTEPGAIDNLLHDVTASTMTLQQPANSVPSTGGIGGVLFNLIDVAQGYTFTPTPLAVSAVSRKTHGGAGTFDIDLPLTGNVGIECRSGGASANHKVVVTFAAPVTVGSASVSSGTGSVSSFNGSGSTVTVNLTGVSNAQTITIKLASVSNGTDAGDVFVPMGVLAGDTNGDAVTNSADVSQTKSRSGQTVNSGNFRSDVTVEGTLNSADVSLVKGKSGTALP